MLLRVQESESRPPQLQPAPPRRGPWRQAPAQVPVQAQARAVAPAPRRARSGFGLKGIGDADGDLGEDLFRTRKKNVSSKPEAVYLTVYPLCIQTECGFTCILCVQTPSGVCLTPRTKSGSAPKVTGDAYDYYQRARNPNKV